MIQSNCSQITVYCDIYHLQNHLSLTPTLPLLCAPPLSLSVSPSRAAYSSIFQRLVTTASSRTDHCTKEDERKREGPFHVPPPSVTQTHANIP